jgi:hypothetical protein
MAELDPERQVLTGRVIYRRIAEASLSLTFEWSHVNATTSSSLTLKGPATDDTGVYYNGSAYYGGAYYYNTGIAAINQISSQGFSPTGKSPGFQLTIQVDSDQVFQIDEIRIPDETPER